MPTSYAAVIEAMGADNVEIGWLAPFAYVLAHDKFETQVILASVREGSKTYAADHHPGRQRASRRSRTCGQEVRVRRLRFGLGLSSTRAPC